MYQIQFKLLSNHCRRIVAFSVEQDASKNILHRCQIIIIAKSLDWRVKSRQQQHNNSRDDDIWNNEYREGKHIERGRI